ncbi:hypothetical protein BV898_04993 [Hypsibius exemplaris]|uniref:Gustatory receptor n=1 Tax=Hypsibius exemplaris TaxID=2072580 RepID=A0A1W0X0G6_HYPEX|nr:hypothetical protein BV898_04993 [Hypsibius exemplaris]
MSDSNKAHLLPGVRYFLSLSTAFTEVLRGPTCTASILNLLKFALPITALWLFLLHDVIDWIKHHTIWARYMNLHSRAISLLAILNSQITFWKYCSSVTFFVISSRQFRKLYFRQNPRETESRGCNRGNLIRKALFPTLQGLVCVRLILQVSTLLTIDDLNYRILWGFFVAPQWLIFVLYYIADFSGSFLYTTIVIVYVQLMEQLRSQCVHYNRKQCETLRVLASRPVINSNDHGENLLAGLKELFSLREELWRVYRRHERLLRSQLFLLMINANLSVYSAVATLFRSTKVPMEQGTTMLSVKYDVAVILIVVFFAANLAEEGRRSVELAQELVLAGQVGLIQTGGVTVRNAVQMGDFVQLSSRRQIVLSVGGCVVLKRPFLLSLSCMFVGYVGFLIQRNEKFVEPLDMGNTTACSADLPSLI